MRRWSTRVWILAAVTITVAASPPPAPDVATSLSYRLAIHSDMKLHSPQGDTPIKTFAGLDYTLLKAGRKVTVVLHQAAVTIDIQGQPGRGTVMTRTMVREKRDGKWIRVPAANLPARERRKLEDTYGVPLCLITVDEHGKELKRIVVAKPGAKETIRSGTIENTRLFHAPFYPDKTNWEATGKISMGNGGFANGILQYQIVPSPPGTPAHLRTVLVTGTLTGSIASPQGGTLHGRHELRGQQTYDLNRGDWVRGRHESNITMTQTLGQVKAKVASGKMVILLSPPPTAPPTQGTSR